MNKATMLFQLALAERLATASKLGRFWAQPTRYLYAIGFRELAYRFSSKERLETAATFFGTSMQVALPAGTDIYLLRAKSHDSEIRLARFMIQHLDYGDAFVDVGAHFGYFSLLGAKLVGDKGLVIAIEAARSNHAIAHNNLSGLSQCQLLHRAANDTGEAVLFHEFDALHSEYNSIHTAQFEGEDWFRKQAHNQYEVSGLKLTDVLQEMPQTPSLIKIDVEGAEQEVIAGAQPFLQKQRSTIVMEFLSEVRGNASHRSAYAQLLGMGYHCHTIQPDGQLARVASPEDHLRKHNLDSDNFVFKE